MPNLLSTLVILLAAAVILAAMVVLHRRGTSFTVLVFSALVIGVLFGLALQFGLGATTAPVTEALSWLNIIGNGYIALLMMLVTPLIAISLIGAFTRLSDTAQLKKISTIVLTTLLSTTAIAGLIGIGSVLLFHLQGANFAKGLTASSANLAALKSHQADLAGLTLPDQITSFFPTNIFADLAGTRATSTIAVVIFSLFVGVAYLGMRKETPELASGFAHGVEVLSNLISRIVKIVLQLTPYGIFALMVKATATASPKAIASLGIFIFAAYVALAVVLFVHTLILLANGINPIRYFKKVWPVLVFAFTSRTSAGSLPLNVKIQTEALGVEASIANFAASFGLTIGQNGCAGVYPSMIATIIAPTVGINVLSLQFIVTLVAIVTISSFGVAGVGGGSTFTTLMVLGALGLPFGIMGIIVAIDPIVDMFRTAVNVNDSMLAGVVAAKHTGMLDSTVLEDGNKVVTSEL